MSINNNSFKGADLLRQAMSMFSAAKDRENAYRIASERNATSEEVARIQTDAQKEIAANRVSADYNLKQMGIDTDVLIQQMKNLNDAEIEQIRGNIQRNLENLKHENQVSRMVLEFSNQLKLHNYDAKAAMRQTLVTMIAKLIGDGKTPWTKIGNVTAWEIASDIVDKTMKPLLDAFDRDVANVMPDLSSLIQTGKLPKEVINEKPKQPEPKESESPIKSWKEVKEESDLAAGKDVTKRPGQVKPKNEHIKKKGGILKK